MAFIPLSQTGGKFIYAISYQSRICKTAVCRLPEKCLFFGGKK